MMALLISSCRKDSADSPIFEINIEDEFSIDLWEELREESRQFRFDIQTIEAKECDNYELEYDVLQADNRIDLTINNLVLNEGCNPNTSQINTEVPLGSLQSGTYFLQINLREEIINKGRLEISSDQYQLEMDSDHGIQVLREELFRVRPNSIWGYVAYSDSREQENAEQFIRDLGTISESHESPEGYYGYFTIDKEDQINLHLDIEPNYEQTFLYRYENDEAILIELLDQYRQTNGDKLEIKVFTASGAVL
ncbi:MAG: hypothetical protein AAFP19_12950 [Bacteroidota bacterium]